MVLNLIPKYYQAEKEARKTNYSQEKKSVETNTQKKQVSEIKILLNGINSRLDTAEENISKLKIGVETIYMKHKKKNITKLNKFW